MKNGNAIVGPWFKTYDTFEAGAEVFLPVVEWKNKNGEPCRGFEKFTEVCEYGGIKIPGIGRPIFIVKITNRSDFSPENIGEKWRVLIEKIEAGKKHSSVNTNGDSASKNQKAIVYVYYVYVKVLSRVENTHHFYNEEDGKYVVETRSGMVSISKDTFPVLEEKLEFLDGNMVVTVNNFFADINGNKKFLFAKHTGGVSVYALQREIARRKKNERGPGKKNKKDKEIDAEAKKEVEEIISRIPIWTGLEDAVQIC